MPPGASIHFTTLIGASCCATCVVTPVVTSNIRAALSAPPEKILLPSYNGSKVLKSAESSWSGHFARLVPANIKNWAIV